MSEGLAGTRMAAKAGRDAGAKSDAPAGRNSGASARGAGSGARSFWQPLKNYLVLTAIYIAVAVGVNALIYYFAPARYFGVYPSMDILYWLCGMALEFFLYRYRNAGHEKLLAAYMMFRFGQLVLTALFLMVVATVAGYEKMPFAISLLLNYFVFTALELYRYCRYNQRYNKSR